MFKLPVSILYAMLAFNFTAFAALLLMDVLIFHSIILKIIMVLITAACWAMVYIKRKSFITLF